ncbi:MAG: tetratricopeptide repeat-containing sensor histidine kinase [Chitinophagaceae bacterium]
MKSYRKYCPALFSKVFIIICLLSTSIQLVWAQNTLMDEYKKADALRIAGRDADALPAMQHMLSQQIGDSLKAEVLARIGIIQERTGMKDSAIAAYQQSLDIFTAQINRAKQSRVSANLGNLFLSIKEYDKAFQYFTKALSLAQTGRDSLSMYLSICQVHSKKENFDGLKNVLLNQVLHFPENLLPDQAYFTNTYLGIYHHGYKNFDSAVYYFKISLSAASTEELRASAFINLGDEFRVKKNYALAIVHIDSALAINRQSHNEESLLAIYDTYVQIYGEMNDPVNALKFSSLARVMSDSIFTTTQAATLQDLDIKYQTAKKEAANQILSKDNTIKQRNFIFSLIGIGLVGLLGAIGFRSYRQKQKANQVLTAQRNQVQQLASELDIANQTKARLFSTIGHDLRGPISSLYSLLKMQEIKGADQTFNTAALSSHTTGLLDTLEDLLIWSKTQMDRFVPMPARVAVHDIYDQLIVFFAASSVEKNILLLNQAAPSLSLFCDENIFRTILRNVISNAMEHAVSHSPVILDAENTNNNVTCTVKNEGKPGDFESLKLAFENSGVHSNSRGLGLVMMKELAAIINASIKLAYTDGWICISIALPASR